MHECPSCYEQCDCDGEDHGQPAPPHCLCGCEDDDWDEDDGCENCGGDLASDDIDLCEDCEDRDSNT